MYYEDNNFLLFCRFYFTKFKICLVLPNTNSIIVKIYAKVSYLTFWLIHNPKYQQIKHLTSYSAGFLMSRDSLWLKIGHFSVRLWYSSGCRYPSSFKLKLVLNTSLGQNKKKNSN